MTALYRSRFRREINEISRWLLHSISRNLLHYIASAVTSVIYFVHFTPPTRRPSCNKGQGRSKIQPRLYGTYDPAAAISSGASYPFMIRVAIEPPAQCRIPPAAATTARFDVLCSSPRPKPCRSAPWPLLPPPSPALLLPPKPRASICWVFVEMV